MKKVLLFLFLFFSLFPQFVFAQDQIETLPPATFFIGTVETVEEKARLGKNVLVQELMIELADGEDIEVVNNFDQENPFERPFRVGDALLLGQVQDAQGDWQYYIHDYYRLDGLLVLLLVFFLLGLAIAGKHSLRAFLGLTISGASIIWILFPLLFAGYSALGVCLVLAVIIGSSALYLAHGWHVRTHVAFLSTMLSVLIAVGLSSIFVYLLQLFGYGTEEAYFLQLREGISIDIRGLLLGGMMIGVLGVLDDVTTTQAATVEQLFRANKQMPAKELYARAAAVGKEHILSLINTLVLAYAGASLPLLLLFRLHQQPWWVTLNSEIVLEEITRMLVGSMVLMLAVPVTTAIAVALRERLGAGEECGHHHVH